MPGMKHFSHGVWGAAIAAGIVAATLVSAQTNRPMSPRRTSSAHVLGTWTDVGKQTFVAGGGTYSGGKWIEISYGSPIKRGRTLFGTGAAYAKAVMLDTPIWRAGADVTTRLKSEVPLKLGTKVVPAGEYSVFIDLKENDWTFVLSTWAAQQ